jgi:hypothetical protein
MEATPHRHRHPLVSAAHRVALTWPHVAVAIAVDLVSLGLALSLPGHLVLLVCAHALLALVSD